MNIRNPLENINHIFSCLSVGVDLDLTVPTNAMFCTVSPRLTRERAFFLSVQDGTAYALLLHQLAPELCSLEPLHIGDLYERAKAVLVQADRINCRKYLTPKDLVEGSPNLNLAFVAHLFHTRFVPFAVNLKQSKETMVPQLMLFLECGRLLSLLTRHLKFSPIGV